MATVSNGNEAKQLICPGCGAPLAADQKECDWCHNPIVIESYDSISKLTFPEIEKRKKAYEFNLTIEPDNSGMGVSLALCYIKLGLFTEAYNALAKFIESNVGCADAYFYSAICLLKGKKAFTCPRPEIDRILQLMNAAVSIEPCGIYYYFMAYIKFDFFKRKFLVTNPTYKDYLALAKQYGCTEADINSMFAMIGIDRIQMI